MAYARRYGGGFIDKPTQTTPIDATFLNAVEAALLRLYALDPTDGQVMAWVAANTRFEPKLLTNANIDPAAAIAKSKLAALGITDADIAGGAAIAASKLAGNIAFSQLAGYPTDGSKFAAGDGTWKAPFTIIRGSVSSAGLIVAGSGFTASRTSLGHYTITFTAAFATAPIVTVTPLISGGGEMCQLNGTPTTGQALISSIQTTGGSVNFFDNAFHFIAIGS